MLISARIGIAAALGVLTFLMGNTAAVADPFGPVYCDQNLKPKCIVRAQTPEQGGGSQASTGGTASGGCRNALGVSIPCYIQGRGSLGADYCYYRRVDDSPPPAGATGPGAWYRRTCADVDMNGPLGVPLVGNLVWLSDGAVPVSPEVLAQEAVSLLTLPLPAIRLSPAPPTPQIVFLPTWVWLDAGSWGSRSATASVPGLSVTATATARRLVLTPGDGATVTCAGRGSAWVQGSDPGRASDCGHTYTSLGTYALRATVTWSVSWVGGGASGTVPDLSTTAAIDLEVREVGALNTGGARP